MHIKHMTHAWSVPRIGDGRSRSDGVRLGPECSIVWMLQDKDSERDEELCSSEVLIWCRLPVLLHFTDKNHNEATPANPRTVAALFHHRAAFLILKKNERKIINKKKKSTPKSVADFPSELDFSFHCGRAGSVCIRWGTCFIAAVTGPAGSGSATAFPSTWKASLQTVLYRGALLCLLHCWEPAPFVAEKKAWVY